jgi:hypothetical protein
MTRPLAPRRSALASLLARLTTLMALLRHFGNRRRWFLTPVLLFVLVLGILLVLTGGLSYVAPFIYTLF